MRVRLSASPLAALCCVVALNSQAIGQTRPLYSVEAATQAAQRTGRPLLTIAGTTG